MKKATIARALLALLLIASLLVGCGGGNTPADTSPTPTQSGTTEPGANLPEKETIKIGAVRSQTGMFALFDQVAFGPCYRMWVADVNAAGGIYVEDYGKKLPVELIVYDDTSDMGTMVQLYQKLILEDEVDFLLPPVSTAFLNAMVPIANQYGYLVIGAEGGSASLKEAIAQYPNFFSVLNYSETQVPAMAEIFEDEGITSAFIVYIQDTHGIEYSDAAADIFPDYGIEILGSKAVPPDIADMTPVISEAKESGAQAFILFTYPDQSFPAVGIAKAMDYNPDVILLGPGGCFSSFPLAMGGTDIVEGVMGEGAWSTKSSEAIADFHDRLQTFNQDDPNFAFDFWGHVPYYVGTQVLQEAIEKTGTLDNAVVADYIRDNHFDTILGDTFFVNQELAAECYVGQIGQWQNGLFEVIDVGDNRTADPIIPKPAW